MANVVEVAPKCFSTIVPMLQTSQRHTNEQHLFGFTVGQKALNQWFLHLTERTAKTKSYKFFGFSLSVGLVSSENLDVLLLGITSTCPGTTGFKLVNASVKLDLDLKKTSQASTAYCNKGEQTNKKLINKNKLGQKQLCVS